jgi:hypothetical protein
VNIIPITDTEADPTQNECPRTEAVAGNSRVITAVRSTAARASRYVCSSFLYRWLTAEPDPEVIVIDLRKTWTVGPCLAVLDRVLTELNRSRAGSRVASLLGATTAALRASPIRVLGAVVATLGATLTIATLLTNGTTTRVVIGLVVLLVGVIATRGDRDWETLRETQLVEVLQRVLEPPAPPENVDNDGSPKPGAKNEDEDQSTDADGLR